MPKKWLSAAEAREYLSGRTEGRLATVDSIGQPYITPLNYIYHEGMIYFHSGPEGRKLANIATNSKVCFEVSHTEKNVFTSLPCKCSTRYTSVLVFGEAQVIVATEEKVRILNLLSEKFAHGRPWSLVDNSKAEGCTVVAVSTLVVTGKRNVDPPLEQ